MIITSTAKTTTQHRPRMKDMRLFVWKKKMKNNSSSFWRVSARTTTTFSHRNRCECIYFVCVSSTFSYGRRLFIGFTQETPNVIYFVAHNALLILVYAIWKWISVAHKWSWEKIIWNWKENRRRKANEWNYQREEKKLRVSIENKKKLGCGPHRHSAEDLVRLKLFSVYSFNNNNRRRLWSWRM